MGAALCATICHVDETTVRTRRLRTAVKQDNVMSTFSICQSTPRRNRHYLLNENEFEFLLCIAFENDNAAFVIHLVNYYSNYKAQTLRTYIWPNDTVMEESTRNDDNRATETQLQGLVNVNEKDIYRNTPLFYVVTNSSVQKVENLLNRGAETNVKNIIHETPLTYAVSWFPSSVSEMACRVAIIKMLLQRGANVHVHDVRGWTPLHLAVFLCHPQIIRLLLFYGADVHAKDVCKWTPLYHAVILGKMVIIQQLLKAGATINDKDIKGRTMLHNAAYFRNPEIIPFLCDRGASINAVDSNGHTPISISLNGFRTENFEELIHQPGVLLDLYIRKTPRRSGRYRIHGGMPPFPNEHLLCRLLRTIALFIKTLRRFQQFCSNYSYFNVLHLAVRAGAGIYRQRDLDDVVEILIKSELHSCLLYLLQAGLRFSNSLYRKEIRHYLEKTDAHPRDVFFISQCVEELTQVRPLLHLSRDAVRQSLYRASGGKEIISGIQNLNNVPRFVKSILLLDGHEEVFVDYNTFGLEED